MFQQRSSAFGSFVQVPVDCDRKYLVQVSLLQNHVLPALPFYKSVISHILMMTVTASFITYS